MRSFFRWTIRIALGFLGVEALINLLDWGGRIEWLENMLEHHHFISHVVHGPLFPLIVFIVCVLVVYGERYLKLPEIHAEAVRIEWQPKTGLAPVKMLDEIHQHMGKESYSIDCDLMLELYLVNKSETAVTVRNFSGVIKAGKSKKRAFAECKDFGRYNLKTETVSDQGGFRNVQTSYVPLLNLKAMLDGKLLEKGRHYQGWIGFTVPEVDRRDIEKVTFTVFVEDGLGHKHEVKSTKNFTNPKELPMLIGPADG